MVWHFVSTSHKVMTALIVMLPSNYLLWRFVCSFIDMLLWTCIGWIVTTMKLSKSCTWERAAVICAAPSCLWTESDFMCIYRKPGVLLHRPMVHFDAHIVIKPQLIQQSAVRKKCTVLLQPWCLQFPSNLKQEVKHSFISGVCKSCNEKHTSRLCFDISLSQILWTSHIDGCNLSSPEESTTNFENWFGVVFLVFTFFSWFFLFQS